MGLGFNWIYWTSQLVTTSNYNALANSHSQLLATTLPIVFQSFPHQCLHYIIGTNVICISFVMKSSNISEINWKVAVTFTSEKSSCYDIHQNACPHPRPLHILGNDTLLLCLLQHSFMGFDFLSVWGNSLEECCFASLATVTSSASDLITLCCSLEYFNNPCTKLALNFACPTSLSTFCLYIVTAFTLVYRDFILLFVSFLSMRNSCNSSVSVLAELGLWWLVLFHHCECRYHCYGLLITPAVDWRCPAYCTVHSFLFRFFSFTFEGAFFLFGYWVLAHSVINSFQNSELVN